MGGANQIGLPTEQVLGGQLLGRPQDRPGSIATPYPATMQTTGVVNQPTAMPQVLPQQMAAPSQASLAPSATPNAQPQMQYGQQGAENAINEYLNSGLGLLDSAGQAALGQFDQSQNQALGMLNSGKNNAMDILNLTSQGARADLLAGNQLASKDIEKALADMSGFISQGSGALSQGANSSNAAVREMLDKGISYLDPYNKNGQSAQNLQAAYSGALGPEAQKAAFDSYMSSPNLKWLRDQGEESIMNQAAATGGVGGGDVLKELQKFGTGLASQDFQNSFDRLGTLSNQGINAAGTMGNLANSAGGQISSNNMNAAQGQAQLAGQGASGAVQLGSQKASNTMNTAGNLAQVLGQYGQQGANIQTDIAKTGASVLGGNAGQRADIIANLGLNGFNAINNAGGNIANSRYQTGTNLANQISNTTGAMSNLTNQQGGALADNLTNSAGSITNLLSGTGVNAAQMQQQLAQLLANLSTGQASQLSGLTQQQGVANGNAAAATGQGLRNTISQGVGAYALLSDRRLKADITKADVKNDIQFYTWMWNEISGLTGAAYGVLSDEIKKIIPDAVKTLASGYDCVDYELVGAYANGTA